MTFQLIACRDNTDASDLEFAFGNQGAADVYYLAGPAAGILPINLALLPGPTPTQGPRELLTASVVAPLSDGLLFGGKILSTTSGSAITLNVVGNWNSVKNVQAVSNSNEKITFDGFVHVDVQVGTHSYQGSDLTLIGAKRANVITGAGGDRVEIAWVSNFVQTDYNEDIRIHTGFGEDTIILRSLDLDAAKAADPTYLRTTDNAFPLTSDMRFSRSYIDAGAGDDTIMSGAGADTVWGGSGDDAISTGSGQDVLIGGKGRDVMTGGTGADIFVFTKSVLTAAEFIAEAADDLLDFFRGAKPFHVSGKMAERDIITDFELGADKLQLDGVAVQKLKVLDVDRDGVSDTLLTFTNGDTLVLLSVQAGGLEFLI
jgi:Ca2+-binding RTX toxin-like protein